MPNGTQKPPTGSTSAKGQEPGRGAGSIEERWRAVEKAVAVYGMAEADVMGVAEVMPEVAVKAAADLRNAQLALALAVLEEALEANDGLSGDYERVEALRARIKAL